MLLKIMEAIFIIIIYHKMLSNKELAFRKNESVAEK